MNGLVRGFGPRGEEISELNWAVRVGVAHSEFLVFG